MNKNEQKQSEKIDLVREAIQFLKNNNVPLKKVNKIDVVLTLKERLYPNNKDKQISKNTLSKPFYKNNFDKWVKEIYGVSNADIRAQRSKEVLNKNLSEKLKRIEKYGNELINKIAQGKVVCPKFTKRFLRDWIVENKGEQLSESIFSSSTEGYKELYERLSAKLLAPIENNNKTSELVSLNEVAKLKQELQVYKKALDNLITQQFVVLNGVEKPLVEGDGNEFKGIFIDKYTLYGYLEFIKKKLGNKIDAYELFKSIADQCKIK
ncbi:hypothetical protein [Bacillus sp. PS06]|uniref:hypothetical protein n=1 Tax=Bacillus sp. PS06 TaxID=2764176 RepID=UPI00178656DB|nr:hypothetical protein [Bacillus sp. PS06]MBD8069300.1 hypothetical protein [Bacillus sp. PS06]